MAAEPEPMTPLEELAAAVRKYAQSQEERPILVDMAVVCWEEVGYDEEGNVGRNICYSAPMDNTSLSAAIGVVGAISYHLQHHGSSTVTKE